MKEGALHELPGGWVWTTIEDILLLLESGGRPKGGVRAIKEGIPSIGGEHLLYNGGFNFTEIRYVPNEFYEKMTRGKILKKDVLVVKDGATTGKTSFVSDTFPFSKAVVNEHVFILRVFHDYIESKYLFFWMESPYGQKCVKENFQGTAQGGINSLFVKNSSLPFPPLPEQRAIASKIEQLFSDLDNGTENFKKAQAQLKLYRQSVLKAACEGKLVPTEAELARAQGRDYEAADVLLACILKERRKKWKSKGEYKEAVAPNTNGLPALPEGWCWVNLEQLKSFSLYGPRYSSEDYANDGYIVLRTSDIGESGKVDISSAPRLNISKEDFSKYKVELGDLLITRTGSLGTLAIFNDNVEAIPGAYLIMYRLVMTFEISWYIFYFLKSTLGQKHLIGGGAGVGRPNLNAPTIEAIPIPLPPLAEQRRIVAEVERRLSVCDKMEATISESLQKAESLRQSILKKAFEGKLLNKKELEKARNASDWEPAEKLLERIRQEKERTGEKRKR